MSTGSVHICCVWKFGDHSKALQGDQKEEFTFLCGQEKAFLFKESPKQAL